MNSTKNETSSIDYATIIEPVYEVSLFGRADFTPWQAHLAPEGLRPYSADGQCELMVSFVDSKFKGIRFQEVSISIGITSDHYFLAHAYNSLAPFAWAERRFFRTPYYKGDIQVDTKHVKLSHGKTTVFEASLPSQIPSPRTGDECWDLTIMLPRKLRQKPNAPHYFYARLEGYTENYAADASSLTIAPTPQDEAINLLKESHFHLVEWRVRAKARHSKSKTYNQTL